MKIINHTEWQTRNLKTFVSQVCEKELLDEKFRKRLQVTFRHRKRTQARPDEYPGGWAYHNSHIMEITLVKGVRPKKWALACVIAHELAHCQGVKGHRTLRTAQYSQWNAGSVAYYAWAKALTLECYAPEPKAIPSTAATKAQAKLANAESLLKQWTTKKKLATSKVQKYKDQVKYYQGRVKELATN